MDRLTKELVRFASDCSAVADRKYKEEPEEKFVSLFPEGAEMTVENIAKLFREEVLFPFSSAYILFDDVRSFMDELRDYLDTDRVYPDHDSRLLQTGDSISVTAKAWVEGFKRSKERTPEEYSAAAEELEGFLYG